MSDFVRRGTHYLYLCLALLVILAWLAIQYDNLVTKFNDMQALYGPYEEGIERWERGEIAAWGQRTAEPNGSFNVTEYVDRLFRNEEGQVYVA